ADLVSAFEEKFAMVIPKNTTDVLDTAFRSALYEWIHHATPPWRQAEITSIRAAALEKGINLQQPSTSELAPLVEEFISDGVFKAHLLRLCVSHSGDALADLLK